MVEAAQQWSFRTLRSEPYRPFIEEPVPRWDAQTIGHVWGAQPKLDAPWDLNSNPWSRESSRAPSPAHSFSMAASSTGGPFNGILPAMATSGRRRAPKERKAALVVRHSTLRPDAPEFVPSVPAPTPAPHTLAIPTVPIPTVVPHAPSPVCEPTISSSSSVCSADSDHIDFLEEDDHVEDGVALSHNYLYHRYVAVLDKALAERAALGPGNSTLVHSLYTFWVSRLTHKFNRNMYRMFVRLALEDLATGDRTGLDSLYRFYCASLRALYRERLFRDFVHFVAAEATENASGVEMLWLLIKDFPRAHQDGVLRCYPDLCAALESLDALGRLSLE